MRYAIFFASALLSVCLAERPTVVSSSLEIKNGQFLGNDFRIALFSTQFDQTLYIIKPTTLCSGLCSTNFNETCPPCNYADTDCCGCEVSSCNICEPDKYCSQTDNTGEYNWEEITIDTPITGILSPGDYTHYFRYYHTTNCSSITVQVHTEFDDIDLYISTTNPTPSSSDHLVQGVRFGEESITLCPTLHSYIYGTYYITLQTSQYYSTHYNLSVTLQTEPALFPIAANETVYEESPQCNTSITTHHCLIDSVSYQGLYTNSPDYQYFYYILNNTNGTEKCYTVLMSVASEDGDADIYASDEFEFPDITGSQYKWGSLEFGNDHIGFSYCFASGQTSVMLYVAIQMWIQQIDPTPFFLTITTQLQPELIDLATLNDPQTLYGVQGTSLIDCDGTRTTCSTMIEWCPWFWNMYPLKEASPQWPVPWPFFDLSYSIDSSSVTEPTAFESGKHIAAMMLSYEINSRYENMDDETVQTCHLIFTGTLVNANYEAFTGPVLDYSTPDSQCSYSEFKQVRQKMDQLMESMDNQTNPNVMLGFRLMLDEYAFLEAYSSCDQMVSAMLQQNDTEEFLWNTTNCFYPTDSDEYLADPCCNWELGYTMCCAPRDVALPFIEYLGINKDLVSQSCGNPDCMEPLLTDYLQVKPRIEDLNTGCDQLGDSADQLMSDCTKIYVSCERQAFGYNYRSSWTCYNDSQCQEIDSEAVCNLLEGTCLVPVRNQEYRVLQCLLEESDDLTAKFLLINLNMTDETNQTLILDAFFEQVASDDCVGQFDLATDSRRHFTYQATDPYCIDQCPDVNCVDTYCILPDTCTSRYYTVCNLGWYFYRSTEDICQEEYYCNWMTCQNQTDITECQNECAQPSQTYFCGWCEDGQHCEEVVNATSEAECLAHTLCLMPNGSYVLDLTEQQCTSLTGQCTGTCYEEQSCSWIIQPQLCHSDENETECVSVGLGEWWANSSRCVYAQYDAAICTSYNFTVVDCSAMDMVQCNQCHTQPEDCLFNCYVAPFASCNNSVTESQCGQSAGYCDDDAFINTAVYPPVLGACVTSDFVFTLSPTNSYQYMDCEGLTPSSVGCIDYSVTSEAACNGTWYSKSLSSTDCLNHKYGCQNEPGWPETTPKDETECTTCQGDYEADFTWTSAVYIKSQLRQLHWKPRQVQNKNTWNQTIDFRNLYDFYFQAVAASYSTLLKSESQCRFNPVLQTIEIAACDCTDSNQDSDKCFTGEKFTSIASSTVCSGVGLDVEARPAYITFYEDSVFSFQDCISVSVWLTGVQQFKIPQQSQLSASFVVSAQSSNPFASLQNSHDAVIGMYLSDGVKIVLGGSVQDYLLCVEKRTDIKEDKSDFPVLDLAVSFQSDLADMKPANAINVSETLISDVAYVCGYIEMPKSSATYFAILRVDNWETYDPPLFTSSELGIIYFTGVMYLVTCAAGLAYLGVMEYTKKTHSLPSIVTLLLAASAFIRTLYYFLAANGKLESDKLNVLVFILTDLPTFLLFSAFTLMIISWASITHTVSKAKTQTQTTMDNLKKISAIANGIMYLLMILVAILFYVLPDSVSDEQPCQSINTVDSGRSPRQVVSLVYQILVAIIALSICIGFLVFGIRFRNMIADIHNSTHASFLRQVTVITVVSALSFMAHCVILLALVASQAAEKADTGFMVGILILMLVEVIPSFLMIGIFSKIPFDEIRSSKTASGSASKTKSNTITNRKSVEMETTTFGKSESSPETQ